MTVIKNSFLVLLSFNVRYIHACYNNFIKHREARSIIVYSQSCSPPNGLGSVWLEIFLAWKRIEVTHSLILYLVGLSIFFTPLLAQFWFPPLETLLTPHETKSKGVNRPMIQFLHQNKQVSKVTYSISIPSFHPIPFPFHSLFWTKRSLSV